MVFCLCWWLVIDVIISISIRMGVIVFSVLMNKVFNRLIVFVVGFEIYVRRIFRIRLIRICFIRLLWVRCWNSFGECCVVIFWFFYCVVVYFWCVLLMYFLGCNKVFVRLSIRKVIVLGSEKCWILKRGYVL